MKANKIKADLLKTMKTITRVMTPKGDINIIFEGNGAWTDHNTICMPLIDFTDDNSVELVKGLIMHESGHVNFTTKGMKAKCTSALHANLTNLFEDIRMERCVMNQFAGAAHDLLGTVKQAIHRGWFTEPTGENALGTLQSYLLYTCRSQFLDQFPLANFAHVAQKLMSQTFTTDFNQELDVIISRVKTLSSTDAAFSLAQEVIDLLEEEKKEQEEQQNDDQQDQDDDADSDDETSDSNSNGDADSDDETSDSDSNDDADSDDETSDSDSNGDADSDDETSDSNSNGGQSSNQDTEIKEPSNQEMAQMMDDILNAKEDDLMKDFHELMKEAIEEESEVAQREGRAASRSMTRVVARQEVFGSLNKQDAINASRLVRGPLERIVMDLNKSATTWHKRGVNLDTNRLALVPAGARNVFQHKVTTRSPLTAISILVDNSGSMGYEMIGGQWVDSLRNMNTANSCSYALAYSLDKLKGVKSEVFYYPHRDNSVHLAKGFNEKVQSCTKHFQVQPQGGTPTGPAMMAALRSISLRPEPKKIMFVLTDGDPDNASSVRDALEAAKHLGVKVVAFGIGSDACQVRGFEDASFVSVEDVSTLHSAVKEVISNSLLGSA